MNFQREILLSSPSLLISPSFNMDTPESSATASITPSPPPPPPPPPLSSTADLMTASCVCGQLQVVLRGRPSRTSMCHCFACQQRTGSVFGVQARFATHQIVSECGESVSYSRVGDSGCTISYAFCPKCGSTVSYRVRFPCHFPPSFLSLFLSPFLPIWSLLSLLAPFFQQSLKSFV
jgi:hypothetical protein